MNKSTKTKKLLNEFRYFSGQLNESDDYLAVSNMMPGVKNASEICKEASDAINEVYNRLEKLEKELQSDANSLHLPAESSYLSNHLRTSLQKVLTAEPLLRKALTQLDSLG